MDPRSQNRIFNKNDSLKTVEEVLGTAENNLGGGDSFTSIKFLSRSGTAYEKNLPYSNVSNVKQLTAGKYPENYVHPIRVRNIYQLGSMNNENKEHVKNFIISNGAVAAAIYLYVGDPNPYYSSSTHLSTPVYF